MSNTPSQQCLRDIVGSSSILNQILPPMPIPHPGIIANNNGDPIIRAEKNHNHYAVCLDHKRDGEPKFFDGQPYYECYPKMYRSRNISRSTGRAMQKTPVSHGIESDLARDIQVAVDKDFRLELNAAASKSNQIINPRPDYKPEDITMLVVQAQNMMLGNGLRAMRIITPESRWFDPEGGCDTKQFLGLEVVEVNSLGRITNPADNGDLTLASEDTVGPAWPSNSIYVVTDPMFLGVNHIVEDVTLELGQNIYVHEWYCWYMSSHAIGNVHSVVRIDLFP